MNRIDKEKEPLPTHELIREKNRLLGAFLRETRKRKHISITTCANLLGISRRRYAAMEEGETDMSFGAVQVLLRFLGVQYSQDIETASSIEGDLPGERSDFALMDNISRRLAQNDIASHQIEVQVPRGEPYAIIIRPIDREHPNGNYSEGITVMVKL